MNFNEVYQWLYNHPIFRGDFTNCVDIMEVKVNPATEEIDDDESKNIAVRFWVEAGPMEELEIDGENRWVYSHDIDLDCGASTYEEAILELYKLVKEKYDY